ncbi:MAG TPA: hypothetical protein VK155_18795 [Bacteroidales bacterium]|nr:hypothetical protein [Bacteroidales bacterium]
MILHKNISGNNRGFLKRSALKIAAGSLISVLGLFFMTGCFRQYYKAFSPPVKPDTLEYLATVSKSFVVHSGNSVFYLSEFKIQGDSASGINTGNYQFPVQTTTFPEPNRTARFRPKLGDSRILNEIHLYVNTFREKLAPGYSAAAFSLKDLWRVDIYEKDKGATDLSTILGVFGIVGGIILAVPAVIFLLAVTVGSCPLIYINSGSGTELAGEIYSGAVYAPLERHDYLALPGIVDENGVYRIKMTNEAKEIENTNLAELFVIDHNAGTEILYDKYGNYQTFQDITFPVSATNLNGLDVLSFISKKDKLCYFGDIRDNNLPVTEGVIVSFCPPEGVITGKLLIRARNSIWLDYVYKNSHDLFGGYYDTWVKKQNSRSREDLIRWSLDQKIPLMVYIERDGKWEFCDYFNNAGPACFRDDVLAINLEGMENDTVRIKLESGAFFWEIDYAAMDFSLNVPLEVRTVPVGSAVTNREADVAGMLKYDDLKYYSQPDPGDEADLEFSAPPLKGQKRSVFLHSRGYYQILSEAVGIPKARKLKALREPGKFAEFSRKLMMEKIAEFSRRKD